VSGLLANVADGEFDVSKACTVIRVVLSDVTIVAWKSCHVRMEEVTEITYGPSHAFHQAVREVRGTRLESLPILEE